MRDESCRKKTVKCVVGVGRHQFSAEWMKEALIKTGDNHLKKKEKATWNLALE